MCTYNIATLVVRMLVLLFHILLYIHVQKNTMITGAINVNVLYIFGEF